MQENICAVGAGPLERLSRPEVPKEIACAECHKCGYARTGDFFSDGTCLRGIMRAVSKSEQQRYKQRMEKNFMDHCKTIAICKQKSGVGKTNTTIVKFVIVVEQKTCMYIRTLAYALVQSVMKIQFWHRKNRN